MKRASNRWLELAVTCDSEAVESVSELFASYGFNQGVAIEEAFTQDPDGDNFAVDPIKTGHRAHLSQRCRHRTGDDRGDSTGRSGISAGSARSAI